MGIPMKTTEEQFAKLQELGAGEFQHLNGSLAAHLCGTEALLRAWGANESLCVAGLFHAVYGTDGYDQALTSLVDRNVISELIGPEAEELAYLYGACNRKVFYPRIGTQNQLVFADRFTNTEYAISQTQLAGMCELIMANELEIAGNSAEFRAKNGAALSRFFGRMSGLVSEAGFQAYRSIFAQAS
jgi:uncharacterized protein DUF6817